CEDCCTRVRHVRKGGLSMVGPAMFPEVDTILSETKTPAERSERLAASLFHFIPGAKLYGCRFPDGAHDQVCVLDETGEVRTDLSAEWDAEDAGGGGLLTRTATHCVGIEHDGNYYGDLMIGLGEDEECHDQARNSVEILS